MFQLRLNHFGAMFRSEELQVKLLSFSKGGSKMKSTLTGICLETMLPTAEHVSTSAEPFWGHVQIGRASSKAPVVLEGRIENEEYFDGNLPRNDAADR